MESSAYYFDKAEQCRGFAAVVMLRDDPVIASLLALAAEFEAKAVEAAIRENDVMVDRHPPAGRPIEEIKPGKNGQD